MLVSASIFCSWWMWTRGERDTKAKGTSLPPREDFRRVNLSAGLLPTAPLLHERINESRQIRRRSAGKHSRKHSRKHTRSSRYAAAQKVVVQRQLRTREFGNLLGRAEENLQEARVKPGLSVFDACEWLLTSSCMSSCCFVGDLAYGVSFEIGLRRVGDCVLIQYLI